MGSISLLIPTAYSSIFPKLNSADRLFPGPEPGGGWAISPLSRQAEDRSKLLFPSRFLIREARTHRQQMQFLRVEFRRDRLEVGAGRDPVKASELCLTFLRKHEID